VNGEDGGPYTTVHGRTRLGLNYWSLSQYLKHQVKNAVNFISQFERVMTDG